MKGDTVNAVLKDVEFFMSFKEETQIFNGQGHKEVGLHKKSDLLLGDRVFVGAEETKHYIKYNGKYYPKFWFRTWKTMSKGPRTWRVERGNFFKPTVYEVDLPKESLPKLGRDLLKYYSTNRINRTRLSCVNHDYCHLQPAHPRCDACPGYRSRFFVADPPELVYVDYADLEMRVAYVMSDAIFTENMITVLKEEKMKDVKVTFKDKSYFQKMADMGISVVAGSALSGPGRKLLTVSALKNDYASTTHVGVLKGDLVRLKDNYYYPQQWFSSIVPVTDWTQVKKDQKILVVKSKGEEKKRYFSHYDIHCDTVCYFKMGASSWNNVGIMAVPASACEVVND